MTENSPIHDTARPASRVFRSLAEATRWATVEFFPTAPSYVETVDVKARYSPALLVGEFRIDRQGAARKVVTMPDAADVPVQVER